MGAAHHQAAPPNDPEQSDEHQDDAADDHPLDGSITDSRSRRDARPMRPGRPPSSVILPAFCPTGPHRPVRTRINPNDEVRFYPAEQRRSGLDE